MIALSIALGFLGLLAFVAYVLWLREGQHLLIDLREERRRAASAHERHVADLLARVVATENGCKAAADAAVAACKTETEAVRAEINQLAAASGFMRRDGSPFAKRTNGAAAPSEVLR